MRKFNDVFNEILLRVNYVVRYENFIHYNKNIDWDDVVKHELSRELSKQIINKIDIKSENNFVDVTYSTNLFVCEPKKLFELFYTFNQLPDETKRRFIKFLSPNEEEYINKVREDILEKIFDSPDNNI